MGTFKDLTGMMFGRLYVLERSNENDKWNKPLWWVVCVCNKYNKPFLIRGDSLRNRNTLSCGCLQKEAVSKTGKCKKKYNRYDLSGAYGIGWTSNTNEEFYFDLEDYDKMKDYCWFINKYSGYIIARNECGKIIRLNRLILGITDRNIFVDHKEHNLYDNRKTKLRIATNQQNLFNKKLLDTNKSGVTGVYWNKSKNKWIARITYNYKCIYLGSFVNKEDAIRAREEAEEKYFSEWSYNNSIKE